MLRSILFHVLLASLVILCVPSYGSFVGTPSAYTLAVAPPTPSVQAADDTLYYVPSDDDWYWDHIERTVC